MKFIFAISFLIFASNSHANPLTGENQTKRIDLCPSKLPKSNGTYSDFPRPVKLKVAIEEQGKLSELRNRKSGRDPPIGTKRTAIGSSEEVYVGRYDAGLLSTVLHAYNEHLTLRTGPDDWWATIITTVSLAIDDNAKEDEVRQFFVAHEGKKTLSVRVGPSVYGTDYSWFFDQMSAKIRENIKVPGYVDQMEPDFSTSTGINRIVSQIMLMNSVQEYFAFSMVLGCGIPYVDMKGTKEDWQKLITKIKALRKTLEPIQNVIGLSGWWDRVEVIAQKLLDTYEGNPDTEWWSKVISERSFGSGQSEFKGWFMVDLLNIYDAENIGNAPSGLVSVPMTVTDGQLTEDAAVVAGMVGYKLYNNEKDGQPILEPMHGWSLLLEEDSFFRVELNEWDEDINDVYLDN